MFSNDDFESPQGKSRKGLAAVSAANGYLRIRIRVGGNRQVMSLGLPDTAINRKYAEEKAHRINLDILSGNFDTTLAKYTPQSALSMTEPDIMPKVMPTAADLWTQYRAYKASSLKETTKLHHEALARILDKTPAIPITDALRVKAELEKVTTIHQTKRILIQLGAVCRWAKKHGLIDSNPYEGMASEMPKYRYQLEPKPNAFTEEERDRLLQAFCNHKGNWNGRGHTGFNYAHYAKFVEFLFLTGCRPSEAIGLRWKQVTEDCSFISFDGAISYCYGKQIRVKGSKNNKDRTFPCSERLRSLLQLIKPENYNPDSLVFPSPKGKPINYNNFCNNAWDAIVDPIKPGTTPYSCRDTFITLQILKGVPESVIAQWCDTSVEMIQKHYVDFLKMLSLRPKD
jgi:integrase